MLRRLAIGLTFLLCIGATLLMRGVMMQERGRELLYTEDMPLLGETSIIKVADLGFHELVADLFWFKATQYYGKHRRTDQEYPDLYELFETAVELDPTFVTAYRFGSLVLSQDAGQPGLAISLLRRGMAANPTRWELPFDLGFLFYVVMNDQRQAGHYFELASRRENAPDIVLRLAGFVRTMSGDRVGARRVWLELLAQAQTPSIRSVAEKGLRRLQRADLEDTLSVAVGRYRKHTGSWPRSLTELRISPHLDALPAEPFGGVFLYDPETGAVRSSSGLLEEMRRLAICIRKVAIAHRRIHGQFPQDLVALARPDLTQSPGSPFGLEFIYDPETGRALLPDDLRPPPGLE